jgi:hypothetical protein
MSESGREACIVRIRMIQETGERIWRQVIVGYCGVVHSATQQTTLVARSGTGAPRTFIVRISGSGSALCLSRTGLRYEGVMGASRRPDSVFRDLGPSLGSAKTTGALCRFLYGESKASTSSRNVSKHNSRESNRIAGYRGPIELVPTRTGSCRLRKPLWAIRRRLSCVQH